MKRIITYIIFIILGLILTYLPLPNAKTSGPELKQTIKQDINVSQRISTKAKENGLQKHKVALGTTALELLEKGNKIKTKGKGKTAYITIIDGMEAKAKENEYWAFYVNGKPATVGAGAYILKEGDIIEWKLEKF